MLRFRPPTTQDSEAWFPLSQRDQQSEEYGLIEYIDDGDERKATHDKRTESRLLETAGGRDERRASHDRHIVPCSSQEGDERSTQEHIVGTSHRNDVSESDADGKQEQNVVDRSSRELGHELPENIQEGRDRSGQEEKLVVHVVSTSMD